MPAVGRGAMMKIAAAIGRDMTSNLESIGELRAKGVAQRDRRDPLLGFRYVPSIAGLAG